MSAVTIDLQDGFYNDEIVISGDGRELARRSGVTTRTQISFAASIELPDPQREIRLEIALPMKNIKGGIDLPPTRPIWIGVSVEGSGSLHFRIQNEPFGYM